MTSTERRRRFRMFVHSKLTWGRLYRTTSYLKSALWTVPLIAIALELLLAPLLGALDAWLGWRLRDFAPAEAQALYQTVITLTLSFLVFTFGSLLVAIQVASGQLTSRIIATTLLRDNVVRYSVGLFVFTLVFAVSALNRQEEAVRELVALVDRNSRHRVHRRLPVPDRLRGASAASGQRRRQGRRRGHARDWVRLS